jgi:protein-S-isoprenylcysteine O-methyltransferase Ste14
MMALSELLRWLYPLALFSPGQAWRWVLAVVLSGVAVALAGSAVLTLRRAHTPVEPWKPTRSVVTDGPYALTRNPIYVAFLALQLAYAWARPNVWGLLLLPLTIALLHCGVIVREERYLAKRFGDAYANYTRRVRRWV